MFISGGLRSLTDLLKMNVFLWKQMFCAISTSKMYGLYFFPDRTVNGETFWNMLTMWLMPQLEHDSADFVYQLDGAPCHYHHNVRNFLNETLPHRWIGRAVNNDQHLLLWPPRSPDLIPHDFFLWGYVKDNAYKPPLPQNVRELQDHIRAVVQTIDGNMLKRVWQELDYRIDICRVTKGAHIEHLWPDLYGWINLDTYITYVWNCNWFWQLISKIHQS